MSADTAAGLRAKGRVVAAVPAHDSVLGLDRRPTCHLLLFGVLEYHMTMIALDYDEFLEKAEESFAGAESEFVNSRYNNCANRCYYAVFQAAIYALAQAGITPPSREAEWGHEFVRSHFIGQLINRRKLYPTALRPVLEQNRALRRTADYKRDQVTEARAARAIRRTEELLAAVRRGGGQP
jgi:uncharacterized protein (UPF0332 family)